MKSRDQNDLKAKREKKESEFQERLKQQQLEKDFQKLVMQNPASDYSGLVTKDEYLRRRKFLFFHLNGDKTSHLSAADKKQFELKQSK